jgi:hypothetical protein
MIIINSPVHHYQNFKNYILKVKEHGRVAGWHDALHNCGSDFTNSGGSCHLLPLSG